MYKKMDRYVIQQPRTLEHMAEEELNGWITTGARFMMELYIAEASRDNEPEAERVLSRQIQSIRKYLDSYMPWKLHDPLARKIVQSLGTLLDEVDTQFSELADDWEPKIRMKVIGRSLEIVISKHLKSLSLDQKKVNHITEFMPTILNKFDILSNLTRFDLICFQNVDIKHLLIHLHKLKSLSLSCNLCTIDLFRCITDNCKLIESLDFIFDTDYEYDECIFPREILNLLCQLSNLKRINLHAAMNYSVAPSIKELLLSCEKLEDLHIRRIFTEDPNTHIYFEEIAFALRNIFMEFPQKRFRIKHYTIQEDSTWEQLQLAVQMCPLIERLSMVVGPLLPLELVGSVLKQLQNLREFELERCNFYTDSIKDILTVIGSKLVELRLSNIQDIDLKALQCLSHTCPNLQTLQIKYFFETENKFDLDRETIEQNILPFRRVRSLTFCGFSNETFFFNLLSRCPNVEYVTVSMRILSDRLLLRVLDEISLTYLRELILGTDMRNLRRYTPVTKLTPEVLQKLMRNCINPLVVVMSQES